MKPTENSLANPSALAGSPEATGSAPDCLYLQWHGAFEPETTPVCEEEVSWCRDKVWPYDIKYARIPNDAFIAPLMLWLVQREGKCAATTISILKRKLDGYIETANHEEWRNLPNDES